MHIIATMRSKTETAQEDNGNGKKRVVQLGMKAEQRDTIIYEFTVVLDLIHEQHYATATKDRTGLFMGCDVEVITEGTGLKLLEWLNSGVDVEAQSRAEREHFKTQILPGLSALNTVEQIKSYCATYKAQAQSIGMMKALLEAYEARKTEIETIQE
jgi:hypothetical protein